VVANGIAHQAASKESLALVDEFEMNRSTAVSVLPVIKF